jgi:hypothetical protein
MMPAMSALLAAMLLLAEPESFRLEASMVSGTSPTRGFEVGGGVELGYFVLPYLRLSGELDGAWVPPGHGWIYSRAFARVLLGADAVLALRAFELFAGLSSGIAAHNFARTYVDYVPPGGPADVVTWGVAPAMRARVGIDLTWFAPHFFGVSVAYALIGDPYNHVHWAELQLRGGFAF